MSKPNKLNELARRSFQQTAGRPATKPGHRNFYKGRVSQSQHEPTRRLVRALSDPQRIDKRGRISPHMLTPEERVMRQTRRQIRAEQASQVPLLPITRG